MTRARDMANLGSQAGSGLGASCKIYLSVAKNNESGAIHLADVAMLQSYNDDTTLYTPQLSATKSGIKILVSATYLFTWSLYSNDSSSGGGYEDQYLSEVSSSNTLITDTHTKIGNDYMFSGSSANWYKMAHSHVLPITANQIINMYTNRSEGTRDITAGAGSTFIEATYLHD